MASPPNLHDTAKPPAQMIYVDDTDPNINYNGNWISQTYTTNNLNATSFSSLPLYGTMHFAQDLTGFPNLTYSYKGTEFYAKLMASDLSGIVCTLDGQPQPVSGLDTLGGALCSGTNGTVRDGTHEVVIGLSPIAVTSLFFDGLTYVPSSGASSTGDVFITSDPSLNLGEAIPTNIPEFNPIKEWHWDFEFIGYSMSLYINYNHEISVIRTNGSYTIDGQGPFNFTSANPLFASTASQLLVQTPRYQLGQHKFHLDYAHDNETIFFSFYGITVQNTTSPVDIGLEIIPPVPSSTSSQSSSSTSHVPTIIPPVPSSTSSSSSLSTSHAPATSNQPAQQHHVVILPIGVGSVVGMVVVVALIILIFWFIRRRRQARSLNTDVEHVDDFSLIIEPVLHNPTLNPLRRRNQMLKNQEQSPFLETIINPNSQSNAPVPDTQPTQRRVVVHEDSGQDVAQPDVDIAETEVLELPPNYTSLLRGRSDSGRIDRLNLPTMSGGAGNVAKSEMSAAAGSE